MNKIQMTSLGYTLIEVMLIVCFMAGLGAASLQGWQGYQQTIQLQTTARQLLNFLGYLQQEANWHNQTLQVNIVSAPTGQWRIHLDEQSCEWRNRYCFIPLASWVSLTENTFSHGIQFYGKRGGATPGHITLSTPVGDLRVILSARGRLRLCKINRIQWMEEKCLSHWV